MARLLTLTLLAGLLAGCQPKALPVGAISLPNLEGPVVVAQAEAPASRPASRPALSPATLPVAQASRPERDHVPNAWIPEVSANNWQWIVIHHSGANSGCAAIFDHAHRQRGWDELGYHFVIGNGSKTPDGCIEVGSRWPKQKWGAHAKTPDNHFNDYGIGICLVGDFDTGHPSPAQLASLARLVGYLMETYHIPPDHVLGHNDCKPTDCPGRNFDLVEVRRLATQVAQGEPTCPQQPIRTASNQLPADEASHKHQ
jgi:hypothetical protein